MHKILLLFLTIYSVQTYKHLSNNKQICSDSFIQNITYFENIKCLSIILLCEDKPEILYTEKFVPILIKSINLTNFKPNFNLLIRPRRDFFDPNRNINKLCAENSHGYLVITKTIQQLNHYIFLENITAFWSPQAKIFIYFSEKIDENNITDIFHNIWSIYKTPHVIITCCKCNISFYNPYVGKVLNISKNIEVTSNFNGYPFKAMVFDSPFADPIKNNTEYVGIDINIAKTIAESLNMSLTIILPLNDEQYGFRLPNGSYTGGLGELLTGKIDFISVDYFIVDYLTIDIEFCASIAADNLCVAVRKAEKVPDWQLLYYCLDSNTWICTIIIYFVISVAWLLNEHILSKFQTDSVIYPFIFTDTFRLLLTSSIFRLPKSDSERVLLAFSLLAAMTLVGAFQGSLFGVYSTQIFYKDINTLQELSKTKTEIKSKFKFFVNDVFTDVNFPVIAKLKSMTSLYNDTESITKRVATQNNFATLLRQSEVDLVPDVTTYLDEKGTNLIHMVKECPRTYSLATILPVNSALAPHINNILLRVSQAGLFVKWYDEMKFNASGASRKNNYSRSDAVKVFSLNDMQIAFLQLLIGLGISAIVFHIELFYNKLTVLINARC